MCLEQKDPSVVMERSLTPMGKDHSTGKLVPTVLSHSKPSRTARKSCFVEQGTHTGWKSHPVQLLTAAGSAIPIVQSLAARPFGRSCSQTCVCERMPRKAEEGSLIGPASVRSAGLRWIPFPYDSTTLSEALDTNRIYLTEYSRHL